MRWIWYIITSGHLSKPGTWALIFSPTVIKTLQIHKTEVLDILYSVNIPDESLILVDNIDTVKDIQYFCLMDLESLYNCGGEN